MEIKIKTAGVEDSDLVYQLTKQAFQDYLGPAFSSLVPALQESKKDVVEDIKEKTVLIAYVDGEAAASVRFYPLENGEYHLGRLGVLNEFSGKNIGRKLIKEVEQRVKTAGGKRITLISAYNKKKLLHFYQRLGYQIEEIREDEDYTRVKLGKEIDN
ncbi:MAG: GNAT family N-acetyltransferase [Bacillota bacterium]